MHPRARLIDQALEHANVLASRHPYGETPNTLTVWSGQAWREFSAKRRDTPLTENLFRDTLEIQYFRLTEKSR